MKVRFENDYSPERLPVLAIEQQIQKICSVLKWKILTPRGRVRSLSTLRLWIEVYAQKSTLMAFSLSGWRSAGSILDFYQTAFQLINSPLPNNKWQIALMSSSEDLPDYPYQAVEFSVCDDQQKTFELYGFLTTECISQDFKGKNNSLKRSHYSVEIILLTETKPENKETLFINSQSEAILSTPIGIFQIELTISNKKIAYLLGGLKMEQIKPKFQLVLGSIDMSLEEILSLRSGMKFELQSDSAQQGLLRFGGNDWATVQLIFCEKKINVEVVDIMEKTLIEDQASEGFFECRGNIFPS